MSLIEQAVKRLEELRRAGAALPEGPALRELPADLPERAPTPEAVVRAIDKRTAPHAGERQEAAASAVPGTARHRYVELDFELLRERGVVTPDVRDARIAEEFGVVKRPLIRNALGRSGVRVKNGNLVMVTSALPKEGKTFTSINLAISIAQEVDTTVLLVDGDVAHPGVPDILGIPNSPGLLDLLTDAGVDVGDALIKTNVENLTILPAGRRQRRATELLASAQMADLLHELGSRYPDRIVIFDSPPLLATTEARVLATHMGQIVLVVAADTTRQHAVSHALATIESCDVVLTMLNKSSRTDVGTYYGYYRDEARR